MPRSAGDILASINQQQHIDLLTRATAMGTMDGYADVLAGGAMSRGAAVGRPLLSGASAILGLDPFSLGLKAGGAVWGAGGGALATGAAGLGVLGAASVAGVGAAFAGGQMLHGANQQLGLNSSMRGLPFMNAYGGMGMTSSQSFAFGRDLRSMTHQMGPAGEMTGFEELSRLAANMGRMGTGDGARTAKEFRDNFKKFMETVKSVAHDLGTSLEDAQKFMSDVRGSGVFRRVDQMRMSSGMRMAALSGGLALSEVSAVANIGSQVARSVGGLGSQGAFAGMRTIEQIGVAQRTGSLSEEDIYNATGLTGAEGRQALATSQLQQSARFLSSGRGRRFLASVADRDGRLDEDAVDEWMGGGMTTGRTMELWNGKRDRIGRANFIRNEGRLRGAALEKFGGLAQSMAYQQWLSSRGYDPSSMDDKSMLAFQRFSGMGRDEADVAIKQIQSMPETLRAMSDTERGAAYSDQLRIQKNTTGMAGLKKQFEHAREKVQGALQGAGARVLQYGQESIEGWFNQLMGIYVSTATEGVESVVSSMRLGGPGAARQFNRNFGGAGRALASGSAPLGSGLAGALKNQGYQIAASVGSTDQSVMDFGSANAELVKTASLASTGGASAYDSMRTFRYQIAQRAKTDESARALLAKFDSADTQGQYAIVQTLQERAGVGAGGQILAALKGESSTLQQGGVFSTADGEKQLGRRLAGQVDTEESRYAKAGFLSKAVGWFLGSEKGELTADGSRQAATSRDVTNWISRQADSLLGNEDRYRGLAAAFRESSGLISDLNGGGDTAGSARMNALDEVQRMRSGYRGKGWEDYSESDRGRIQAIGGSLVASKYGKQLDRAAAGEKVDLSEALREYASVTGDTSKDASGLLKSLRREGQGAAAEQQLANARKMLDIQQSGMMAERESLARRGIARIGEGGKIELLSRGRANREGLSAGQLAADDLGLSLAGYDLTRPTDAGLDDYLRQSGVSREQFNSLDPERQKSLKMLAGSSEYNRKTGELYQSVGDLSLGEKRRLARGGGAAAKVAGYEAQVEQRFAGLAKRGGGEAGAVGRLLGLGEDDIRGLAGMDAGSAIDELMQRTGIQNKGLAGDLKSALMRKTIGGRAAGVDAALANLNPEDRQKLQERTAQQQDPSYRALEQIRQNSDKQTRSLDILVKSNDAANDYLKKLSTENPEGAGQAPSGATGGKK